MRIDPLQCLSVYLLAKLPADMCPPIREPNVIKLDKQVGWDREAGWSPLIHPGNPMTSSNLGSLSSRTHMLGCFARSAFKSRSWPSEGKGPFPVSAGTGISETCG